MSEQKRRFLERTLYASATPTFIGAESVVVGNIRGNGQDSVAQCDARVERVAIDGHPGLARSMLA